MRKLQDCLDKAVFFSTADLGVLKILKEKI